MIPMAKYLVTLVEPHGVITRDDRGRILGSLRRRAPLHSQQIIGATLREGLGDNFDVRIYNPKLADPNHEEHYHSTSYGPYRLTHYRVGESFNSSSFRARMKETDILGITVNFTQVSTNAISLARAARAINPKIKIIYGGSDASATVNQREFYLKIGGGHVIVPKDAEDISAAVVRALVGDGSLGRIAGISHNLHRMSPQHNLPVPTPSKERMKKVPLPALDLVEDQIPRWTEDHEGPLPKRVETPIAYVEFARGCHERCDFCTIAGVPYSAMDTEQAEAFLKHFRKYGIKSLMIITDNELTLSLTENGRSTLLERYRLLKHYDFRWNFGNGLQYSLFRRKDGSLDSELMDAMFSGAYCMYTPLEDPLTMEYEKLLGHPRLRIHDHTDAATAFERSIEILEYIAATGIPKMTFGFLMGGPADTVDRVRAHEKPLRMLKERLARVNPHMEMLFTPFIEMPLPGTANYELYHRSKLIKADIDTDPELWQFALTTFGNYEMVEERLRLIALLNGQDALDTWTSTGLYPKNKT